MLEFHLIFVPSWFYPNTVFYYAFHCFNTVIPTTIAITLLLAGNDKSFHL